MSMPTATDQDVFIDSAATDYVIRQNCLVALLAEKPIVCKVRVKQLCG